MCNVGGWKGFGGLTSRGGLSLLREMGEDLNEGVLGGEEQLILSYKVNKYFLKKAVWAGETAQC